MVLGGGASGFFAAINIAQKNPDYEVIILEKTNQLLSKVKVSGGGRCNVTHACFDARELVGNYPRGEKELLGPFHRYAVGDVISWFMERGVELKMEEDGRMFPVSNSSQTIIDCFLAEAKRLGIKIWFKKEVLKIRKEEKFELELKTGEKLMADKVVMAMGGSPKRSHYQLLQDLDLHIIEPIASLFTFNLPKHPSNKLMGLSLPAEVKLRGTNLSEYGPVLFTHWGMSGPAILKLSSKGAPFLHKKNYQFDFEVVWMDQAMDFIQKQRKEQGAKNVLNQKPLDFPQRFWAYVVERAGVNTDKNWADLSKSEMERLSQTLEHDIYTANGKTTFKEEFVSCGGLDLNEIHMKSMECKKIPGLFFCGELIHVDALTGGFNFQAAWTTAWLVSEHI